MTISYRSTQDPQESKPVQDPQRADWQHPGSAAPERQANSAGMPQAVPGAIQPRVVGRPQAGLRFFTSERAGAPPEGDVEQQVPTQSLPIPDHSRQSNNARSIEHLHTAALPGIPHTGPASNGASMGQPTALHPPAGARIAAQPVPVTPQPASAPGLAQSSAAAQPKPEIEGSNVILYRRPNFFVRTAYRPGQRQHPLRRPTGHTRVMPRVMPHQDKRIAASDTRLMPKVTLDTPKQTKALPLPAWLEAIIVVLGLLGTLVAHAYNMFNFPRYELDEGTYMANAWAITQGMISPYPYGYGHPPLTWMQIAAWLQLTGGVFTFGNALNSGRVFMLFYAVGSALLVYLIVRRLGGSRSAALLAMVIFSFSPLSITYQRQVFLDNVATFWMLLALYLLVVGNSRLLFIVGAAIAFGFSVLSKEVYLICFPAMVYAAWLHTTKFQRKFGLVAFVYVVIALCSAFVLMAVLKDELFPYSWHLPWDHHPHLSMLDTFVGQAQRGQTGGSFLYSWNTWLDNDMLLIIFSLAAPLFNLVYGWWNRKQLLLALLAIVFWLLLVRGGQVLSFYIIPLIPLIALNTAMALNTILGWLGKLVRFDLVRAVLLVIVIAVILPYDIKETGFRFYQHPTSAQQDALVWIRNHVPHNSFIVINSYLYLDLRVPGGQGLGDGAPYPHAEVYWNVAFDPELHDQALQGNWDRIDYIVADSEMLHDIETYGGPMDLIKTALDHSILRADFRADDHNLQIVVQVYQVMHKFAPPVVYSTPGSHTGALAQSAIVPQGPPGGDQAAPVERWAPQKI